MNKRIFLLIIALLFFPFVSVRSSLHSSEIAVKPEEKSLSWRESCYSDIHAYIKNYQRPITAIDLQPGDGFFSFALAKEFSDSTWIMVQENRLRDKHCMRRLLKSCKDRGLSNMVLLTRFLTRDRLDRLGECEHFDVVLALNLIDHIKGGIDEYIDAILRLGEVIFVRIPPIEQSMPSWKRRLIKDVTKILYARGLELISANSSQDRIFQIARKKQWIKRKSWILDRLEKNTHAIHSTLKQKKLIKRPTECDGRLMESTWLPGINLITFKMMQGVCPTNNHLAGELKRLSRVKHSDWNINNMIIQGQSLALIDMDDLRWGPARHCSQQMFDYVLGLIRMEDPTQIEDAIKASLAY